MVQELAETSSCFHILAMACIVATALPVCGEVCELCVVRGGWHELLLPLLLAAKACGGWPGAPTAGEGIVDQCGVRGCGGCAGKSLWFVLCILGAGSTMAAVCLWRPAALPVSVSQRASVRAAEAAEGEQRTRPNHREAPPRCCLWLAACGRSSRDCRKSVHQTRHSQRDFGVQRSGSGGLSCPQRHPTHQ